jgi:hypothetical protein
METLTISRWEGNWYICTSSRKTNYIMAMETNPELNKELHAEVNATFASLYKEIGNNRQQLANKVLGLHKELNKELGRSTVTEQRKKEILAEVARIVKMAAQQLPHLKFAHPKPVSPSAAAVAPVKPVAPKHAAPEKKAHAKATTPPAKKAAKPSKPSAPAKKTSAKPKAAGKKKK